MIDIKKMICGFSKNLGQNFLIDKNILNKIVNILDFKDKSCVEIGAGIGNLSYYILQKDPKNLIMVEKDKYYADKLIENVNNGFLQPFSKKIQIINKDILEVQIKSNIIIGNLPYYISKDILIKSILENDYEEMLFMLQKEVVDKIIAQSGDKAYGALSVFIQLTNDCKKMFEVSNSCFYPIPKVTSAIIYLKNKNLKNKNLIKNFIFDIFQNRRKKIKNLTSFLNRNSQFLDIIQPYTDLRAEEISIQNYNNIINNLIDLKFDCN